MISNDTTTVYGIDGDILFSYGMKTCSVNM